MLLLNGASIARYSVYRKLDYIIWIDVPFAERQERVIKRQDRLLEKHSLVKRDQGFRIALKKAKRSGKQINLKINNTGTREQLQDIADRIYEEQILNNGKQKPKAKTMKQKYGGHKTEVPSVIPVIKRKKDDLVK